ncbi:MAG: polyketide synthase dehydratase domain-containing protein, partial [Isosphaeraceae bacterium]|nr:polyketide synthase dehydratase domain-containing protein [Isosphaeraceae bacterium]
RAYRASGIDPVTVGLIEGHGLGVPASDKAELRALRAVFSAPGPVPRTLGAVSSLIGHAMPAAGIAGLIKTALALHHRVLPATPHAEEPHPLLASAPRDFRLNRATRPWIHGITAHPRRAGVNAFGFAGINAHAILEEHSPSADGVTPGALPHWETEAILIGAPDRATWLEIARALADWLEREPNRAVPLKDLAYTLNCGQPAFPCRVGLVVSSTDDLRTRLNALIARLSGGGGHSIRDARGTYYWETPLTNPGKVAFVFPGEGSQYPGMLADLCPHFPEVRRLFDTSDRLALDRAQARVPSEVLFGDDGLAAADGLWAMETATNVVLSAQWALYTLLSALGLYPDAVVGHSSGEFLALAAAGVLRVNRQFEDRLGELSALFEERAGAGEVPEAQLLAVAADRQRVERLCEGFEDELAVAIDNCPHQVVVCGAPGATEKLAERLRGHGILFESLPFSRAYHTPEFATALGPIRAFFDAQAMTSQCLPVYSCATAAPMPSDPDAVRALAVDQWARRVEFRDTIEAMYRDGARIFVEVGTRGNLTGFVEDTLRGRPHFAVAANLPRRSGLTQLNHLVASLFAQGVPLRADLLYARRRPAKVGLATDLPVARAKPALKVGFPEMRLTESLASRLRARSTVSSNGHVSYGVSAEPIAPALAANEVNGQLYHAPADPSREQAMLSYFETMNTFLETQRQVLRAYNGAPHASNGQSHQSNGHTAYTNGHTASVLATPPSEPEPAAHVGDAGENALERPAALAAESTPAAPSLGDALIEQVALRTGYPRAMLDIDLDIEGDLGIDSIKRVEILGELQNKGLMSASADLDRLSRCRTLRQVIEFLGQPATQPAAPVAGPWVGAVEHLAPGRELRATRWLDSRTDPVAEHHTIGGRRVSAVDPTRKGLPVLPFTVMAEMIAQAAALLVPDRVVVALRDVEARRWIKYEEEPFPLELRAARDPSRPDEVRVGIYGRIPTGKSGRRAVETPLVEGTVVFGLAREAGPPAPPFALAEPRVCRFTARELYADQWLFHGPALQAVVRVGEASPGGIEGTLRVLPRAALCRAEGESRLITDPIVLDAFTHLLGCWGLDEYGDGEGDVIFPLRLAELTLYDPEPAEGVDVECRIQIQDVSRHRVRIDADFVAPGGRTWMRLKDWEDWRFYWPGRYRDHFRAPDQFLLGEPLTLPGLPPEDAQLVCAAWLEPPADMTRPVWRDVLEWVQLEPEERRRCRQRGGPDTALTHRLFGRIAAKEAVRRLWADRDAITVYPSDLVIDADSRGKPFIRSLLEPDRADLPAISLTHTEGVALALAALEPHARPGIDVERVVEREPGFEDVAFTDDERRWLDAVAEADRAEWIARFWCAKEAVAKSTGFALLTGPSSVLVVGAERGSGSVSVVLGSDLVNACRDWDERAIQTFTARRGEFVWAWTLGRRIER